jgi:hypothetical protein
VSAVEVTTRYATRVGDLSAAWSFVMEKMDQLGADPSIKITPAWRYPDGMESHRVFDVVVSGMVEEPAAPTGEGS